MTIEGNKDEAEKCIEIAQFAISTGNLAKAEKFLAKAERLYPTQHAKHLLARVETLMSQGGGTQNVDSDHSQSEARRRKPSTPTAATSQKEYTSEQLAAVRRINIKCKDYYEILGVTKEATDSDIKKSYKRLALQLHPDKNRAPGAAEAFKAIGNAAAVLTDAEKRKAYDLRGEEPAGVAQHHGQHHYYARGFESDLTAEELFNMFFGQAGQRVYTRRHYARETERQQDNTNNLFQLLPVLILVIVSMMSSFFISDPPYNLQRTSKYTVLRETNNLKVPYYVKDNFHTDYQGSLKRLEMSIEEEYLVNLRHACQRERNYKETMAWKARNFGDSRQYQEAQKMRMPSCEKLQSYHR